jgi:hypothetical protein
MVRHAPYSFAHAMPTKGACTIGSLASLGLLLAAPAAAGAAMWPGLCHYRQAQRRFRVGWHALAEVK